MAFELFVNGTLMRGLALHDNLAGATFVAEARTAPIYRLYSIADRHPGLKLIIDHYGRPDAAWSSLPKVLALAKRPNIALKATGGPSYSREAYPFRDIEGHIRKLYDAFGPERMFWGTDITRMPCSWRQCVTHFTEALPWLSAKDKDLIMGRALCNWLGWNLA